jgi:hypothetical protein
VQRTFAVLGEDVVRGTVLQNRQFLGRAVRYLAAGQGIRQFLDIGTGLPTMNSVHQVAQSAMPDSRVVYVDNDRCKSGCSHVTTVVARLCAPNGGPAGGRARRHLSLLANRMEQVRAWLSADWRQRLAVPAPGPGCCCSGCRPSGRCPGYPGEYVGEFPKGTA